MLELKLQASSGFGISRLKEDLFELEKVSGMFGKKDLVGLEQTVAREITLGTNLDFFKAVKNCLKEAVVQPLLFGAHPPLRRSLRGKHS